jgi:hypothetical protein
MTGNFNLHDYLIQFIEDNKVKYDISYGGSIESLYELLDEIKQEYEGLDNE